MFKSGHSSVAIFLNEREESKTIRTTDICVFQTDYMDTSRRGTLWWSINTCSIGCKLHPDEDPFLRLLERLDSVEQESCCTLVAWSLSEEQPLTRLSTSLFLIALIALKERIRVRIELTFPEKHYTLRVSAQRHIFSTTSYIQHQN